MKFVFIKSFCSLLFPSLLVMPLWANASEKQVADEQVKWSYSGASGPSHWGDLSPEYNLCKQGKNQSPVNINKSSDARLSSVKFDYSMLIPGNIINNGHTIQVNIRSGGSIELDGKDFVLKQFHFHSPSENMIDSLSYPLEAHFVHANKENENELAVVALLYRPGFANPALQVLVNNLPLRTGSSNRLGAKDVQLYETSKKENDYFRFNGSLTTPPCTEGVHWIVMKATPTVSKQQLLSFQRALKHPNNRPVQPLNARIILR